MAEQKDNPKTPKDDLANRNYEENSVSPEESLLAIWPPHLEKPDRFTTHKKLDHRKISNKKRIQESPVYLTLLSELEGQANIGELIEHLEALNKDLPERLSLHQPTKILISAEDEIRIQEQNKGLEGNLEKKSQILSTQVSEDDFKELEVIISLLKLLFLLSNAEEKIREIKLKEILKTKHGKKITEIQQILNNAIDLHTTVMFRIMDPNEEDKKNLISSKKQDFLIEEINKQLESFTEIQRFLLEINTLTPEQKLQKILNEPLTFFSHIINNTTLQILEKIPSTVTLYEKFTAIKKIPDIIKYLGNAQKLAGVIELTKDKKFLESKEHEYKQLSVEFDTKTTELQNLLKQFDQQDLITLKQLLNTFNIMTAKLASDHPKYQQVVDNATQLNLICDALDSMIASQEDLLYLKSIFDFDVSKVNDFNQMNLPVIIQSRHPQLFEKLNKIKEKVKEIFEAKKELENFQTELDQLIKLTDYQLITSENETTKSGERLEAKLLLSEIIKKLNNLEKQYDASEYESVKKDISAFLTKLKYTLGLIVRNFSYSEEDKELTKKMRGVIKRVKNIETKLTEMQTTRPETNNPPKKRKSLR